MSQFMIKRQLDLEIISLRLFHGFYSNQAHLGLNLIPLKEVFVSEKGTCF